MKVLDLYGSKISYKSMMEAYHEGVFGKVEPTCIKAEPKTMENILRWMLPYVCKPGYTGGTIVLMFHGAGFSVDPDLDRGTILFEVDGHPVKIVNMAVED